MVVFLAGTYVWYEMRTGRHLIAIGANKEAANALGVATRRLPCVIYILSGTAAALGGLIITSQLDGASVQIGVGLELQVLTAILLGGVAFTGGRGSLWGTLAGILFIGVLEDGLILINVGPTSRTSRSARPWSSRPRSTSFTSGSSGSRCLTRPRPRPSRPTGPQKPGP